MLTGMVGVRTPSDIRKAREATEAYLKKLSEANPLLDVFRVPAGRTTQSREFIPYFFAWTRPQTSTVPATGGSLPPPPPPPPEEEPQGATTSNAGLPEDWVVVDHAEVPAEQDLDRPPSPLAVKKKATTTIPRPRLVPYEPLFSRRKADIPPPKVTEPEALKAKQGKEEGQQEAEEEAATIDEQSALVVRQPSLRTEYMDHFKWWDAEALKDIRVTTSNRANASVSKIFWTDEEVAATGAGTSSPPRTLVVVPERAKVDHVAKLLEALETGDAGGETSSAPSSPLRKGRGQCRMDTDHCWGLMGGGLVSPTVSGVALSAAVAPPTTSVQSSPVPKERKPGPSHTTKRSGKGKKRIKKGGGTTGGLRPFNPILLHPRYPPTTPGHSKSEYSSKFVWGTPAASFSL